MVTKPYTFTDDTTALPEEVNINFDQLYDFVENLINATDYNSGAFNSATLNAAITDIGSANKVLYIPAGTWTISEDVTVPSNIYVKFANGTIFSNPSNNTVTFNGGTNEWQFTSYLSGKKYNILKVKSDESGYKLQGQEYADIRDFDDFDPTGSNSSLSAYQQAFSECNTIKIPDNSRSVIDGQLVFPAHGKIIGDYFGNNKALATAPVIDIDYGLNNASSIALLLREYCSVKNVLINYPEQLAVTESTPNVYGWAIGTDTNYICDDIELENIMILNPYQGINLDRAGRLRLKNIKGHPLSKGLYLNRIYDVPRMENVHFWTFYASPSDNMYNWILNNGRAFDFNRVDGLKGFDIFCYGYKEGLYCDNIGDGSIWATLLGLSFDTVQKPIYLGSVSRLNIVGGGAISKDIEYPCITTSTSIGGSVKISDYNFHENSSINAIISSSNGDISFNTCKFNAKYSPIINESTCDVKLNNCNGFSLASSGSSKLPFGKDATYLDGINMPALDTDVSPSNFDMSSWAGGMPNNWSMITGSSSNIQEITDGVALNLTPIGLRNLAYRLPNDIQQRKGLYVLKFDYEAKSSGAEDNFRFKIMVANDVTTTRDILYTSNYALLPSKKVTLHVPIYMSREDYHQYIIFNWEGYGTVTGTLELTNLSLYEQDSANTSDEQISKILKYIHVDTADNGRQLFVNAKNKIVKRSAAPTAGTWIIGDKAINNTPTAGGYEGWVCVTAGTPGTWKGYGAIQV